jgi:hypothetical protein
MSLALPFIDLSRRISSSNPAEVSKIEIAEKQFDLTFHKFVIKESTDGGSYCEF